MRTNVRMSANTNPLPFQPMEKLHLTKADQNHMS